MATEQLDLIDRKALLRRICAERDEVEIKTACDIGYHNGLNMGASMTINAPTIEARPVVHGRWLFDRNTERYFCSVCNEEALYTSKDDPIFDYDWEENLRYSHTETILEEHLTDYCPKCGAQMDGG